MTTAGGIGFGDDRGPQDFHADSQGQVEGLAGRLRGLQLECESLAAFFGEDHNTCPPQRVFEVMVKFVSAWNASKAKWQRSQRK